MGRERLRGRVLLSLGKLSKKLDYLCSGGKMAQPALPSFRSLDLRRGIQKRKENGGRKTLSRLVKVSGSG